MELIFGGAYQGKLEYALNNTEYGEKDIFDCRQYRETDKAEIDFSKKIIYHLEDFVALCYKHGIEPKDYIEANLERLGDSIIICNDVSMGVVPMDKDLRAIREMNGRTLIYLSKKANKVIRIFCGLPHVLKEEKGRKKQKSFIHFIRHGITEGNKKRWYYGSSDISLDKDGVELLEELTKRGIYPNPDEGDYYTTGMKRTEETFEIIYGEKNHRHISLLQEMDFGIFEKKSYEELKENAVYQKWINDETGESSPPEGESINDFHRRIQKGYEELSGYHKLKEFSMRHEGKTAHSVIVCHGGVISSIMQNLFAESENNFYDWIPDPAHGYSVEFEDGRAVRYEIF